MSSDVNSDTLLVTDAHHIFLKRESRMSDLNISITLTDDEYKLVQRALSELHGRLHPISQSQADTVTEILRKWIEAKELND